MKKRVVITRCATVTPYGTHLQNAYKGISDYKYFFSYYEHKNKEILIGKVLEFLYTHKNERVMPRMGKFAHLATTEIVRNLIKKDVISTIISGCASAFACEKIFKELDETGKIKSIPASLVMQTLGNAVASNIATTFGFKGRCVSPSAACAGSIQSIIEGYELLLLNKTDQVICGGTEEFHPLTYFTFSKLGIAANTLSIPFDVNRNGVVCSEGAGLVLLEEYKEGKPYIAEIVGVGINNSNNMLYSNKDSIIECMSLALKDAGLEPSDIKFINSHATATQEGDMAEGLAISELFPHRPYINSLKGYLGHTMAASGAIELILNTIALNNKVWFGIDNLKKFDISCGDLNVCKKHIAVQNPKYLLKNSFGLGGINTTIIVKVK